jgi:hypothetical protein
MTDLELVKRCAEKMKIDFTQNEMCGIKWRGDPFLAEVTYNPLKNDAQAMALLKKFIVECQPVIRDFQDAILMNQPFDFNRAICECVAGMEE